MPSRKETDNITASINTKDAAAEVLQNLQPFVSKGMVDLKMTANRGEDSFSKKLLLGDFKDFSPLRSSPDGNCLFNSTSILINGDESVAGLLRLLVYCELVVHTDFYAGHPQFREMTNANSYTVGSLLTVLLSNESSNKIYNGNKANVP